MKILVCVKSAVPVDQKILIDDTGKWVVNNSNGDLPNMGRYDELAVEQALVLKDNIPGTTADIITVGPARNSSVLRRAMGMGADQGVHILYTDEGYVSATRTVALLAPVIRSRSYNLILAGVISEDMSQGLVGPMLAETLGIPCVTSCVRVGVDDEKAVVTAERDMEGSRRQTIEINLPALVTIQACASRPRYPSLSNIIRANSQEIETIRTGMDERMGDREQLLSLNYPEKTRTVKFLQGTAREKAQELVSILREKAFLNRER